MGKMDLLLARKKIPNKSYYGGAIEKEFDYFTVTRKDVFRALITKKLSLKV